MLITFLGQGNPLLFTPVTVSPLACNSSMAYS